MHQRLITILKWLNFLQQSKHSKVNHILYQFNAELWHRPKIFSLKTRNSGKFYGIPFASILEQGKCVKTEFHSIHYHDVTWASWHLQSLFDQQLVQANNKKYQSSELLYICWGIHQWPGDSPHKGPVMEKVLPCHDIIMSAHRKPVIKQGPHNKHMT